MEWIKVEAHNFKSNVPFGKQLLVSNGSWVQYVDEHGWDNEKYYFHNVTGKLEGVTHFMIFPLPPKKDEKWIYECYVCNKKTKGSGELVRDCDC